MSYTMNTGSNAVCTGVRDVLAGARRGFKSGCQSGPRRSPGGQELVLKANSGGCGGTTGHPEEAAAGGEGGLLHPSFKRTPSGIFPRASPDSTLALDDRATMHCTAPVGQVSKSQKCRPAHRRHGCRPGSPESQHGRWTRSHSANSPRLRGSAEKSKQNQDAILQRNTQNLGHPKSNHTTVPRTAAVWPRPRRRCSKAAPVARVKHVASGSGGAAQAANINLQSPDVLRGDSVFRTGREVL